MHFHFVNVYVHMFVHFFIFCWSPKLTSRKDILSQANKAWNDLDHVLTWKELPSGLPLNRKNFEDFMKEIVISGEADEDNVGGINGQLQARRRRSASSLSK